MNLLRFVLDSETKASLKRIDTRLMDPASLDDVARQWAAEGNVEKALLLLEPLFDSGAKFPKHAELLLDTLFDIWPAHHKPMRRSKLAERLASGTIPLDKPDEAAVELRKGKSIFREIRKRITQENIDRPEDIDYDAIGSRDEAWLYRQAMRHTLHV